MEEGEHQHYAEDNTDVFTFLHRAGARYKEHLELLKRQREEEERRIGSGHPIVSPFANEWSEQTTRKSEAVEQRLHRLHQKRLEKLNAHREQAQREKAEKETEEMHKKLNITEMGRHHSARDPAVVTEKFLDDHRKHMKQLAEESIRRELSELQPKPKITPLADTLGDRKQGLPIEEHLIQVEKQRQEKLYAKVEEKTKAPVDSFHPTITPRAMRMPLNGNVVERLYTARQRVPLAYDETYERECTFQPFTNRSDPQYEDPCKDVPVHERLHENMPRAMSKNTSSTAERDRQERYDPVSTLSFTPRISKTSQRIIERKREQVGDISSMRSPTSRLYDQRPGIAQHKKSSQDTSTSSVSVPTEDIPTFKPRINARSAAIYQQAVRSVECMDQQTHTRSASSKGSKKTVRELFWEKRNNERDMFIEQLREDVIKRETAECTFEPNAAPQKDGGRHSEQRQRTAHRTYPQDFADRENMWVVQRDHTLQRLKEDVELTELEGCTFHPEVHKEVPMVSPYVPNAVGFEQHLKRQEEARQRRYMAEELNNRTPRATKYRGEPTKPVPFVLGRDRERQQSQLRQNTSISSLRPPISHNEWSQVRAGLDDNREMDGFYTSQREDFDTYHMRRHESYDDDHGDNTTFEVKRPQQQRQGVTTRPLMSPRDGLSPTEANHRQGRRNRNDPNPVEFIMSNHHNIMRSLMNPSH